MQLHNSSTVSSGYNGGVGRFVLLTLYPNDAFGKIVEKGSLEQHLNIRLENLFTDVCFSASNFFWSELSEIYQNPMDLRYILA